MSLLPFAFYRHAFSRSRLRVRVVLGLDEFGECGVMDLSRVLGSDARHVYGALVGAVDSFRVSESLVRLHLVERRVVREVELFRLTQAGRDVAVWLREDLSRSPERRVRLLP